MTSEYEAQIERIRERLSRLSPPTYPVIPDLDDWFESAPEGDFRWDADDIGDWHVYCCGDKDCEQQWHRVAYALNMGRSQGQRWVEQIQCDEDGNWDTVAYWEEDGHGSWDEFYREFLALTLHEYFVGWVNYWVACAESGSDPCAIAYDPPPRPSWTEFCLDAARGNLRSLVS